MFRLMLKAVFWLSLVIYFIPLDENVLARLDEKPGAGEIADIAHNAISDVAGFCERNDKTCSSGEKLAHIFWLKMQKGYDMVVSLAGEDSPSITLPIPEYTAAIGEDNAPIPDISSIISADLQKTDRSIAPAQPSHPLPGDTHIKF